MKPRNKFEKAILAQSKYLRSIRKSQINWAFRECIDHYAYRLPKGRTTCMDCGHDWMMKKQIDTCICPGCGAKLKTNLTYCRKLQQKQYFTVLTTSGGYQVLRMFILIVEMEKGYKAKPCVFEIGQYWWNEQGRKAVVAIQRVMGHYVDTFSFASPMAIRQDNNAYRHIAYSPIYPKFKVTSTLRRNGFKGDFHGIVPITLIPALLTDSKAETLLKARQYPMLSHYLRSSFEMDRYWASIKICIRNGYTIEDGSMWRDTIDILRHFGKDTNSPKYVCLTDLKAKHDKWTEKKRIEREREELVESRRKAKKNEKKYKELKGRFFGLAFTDGILNIRVLESVEEFAEEGAKMRHCIFSNSYYLKENSLILSATINGKRIETIEVSLKTLQVVQSRGACNSNTEYHERIINLINKNINLIQKRIVA